MTYECRILTPSDEIYIPSFHDIFTRRLSNLEDVYPTDSITKARGITLNHFRKNLPSGTSRRLIGHFTDHVPDGILIESFDMAGPEENLNRTLINWLMADVSGKGVGTRLTYDCLNRAKAEGQDVVGLGVARKNEAAVRLYQRIGFVEDSSYNKERFILMNYYMGDFD